MARRVSWQSAALAAAVLAVLTANAAAQALDCSVTVGAAAPTAFADCVTINSVGDAFVLSWTLNSDGSVAWGMRTSGTGGYVSFAFPEEAGDMVPAEAFSLQACASCPGGAQLKQWHLGGFATGDMKPSNSVPTTNVPASGGAGGMAATFTAPLPAGANPSQLPLIFAAGSVYPDGSMRQHNAYSAGFLDLQTGALTDEEPDSRPVNSMLAAHLWLMLIGWGVLIPLGIVAARTLKHRAPLWFKLHRAIQCVGLLLGLVGLGLGFYVAGGWNSIFGLHRNLGMAATVLGVLQLPALAWRPALTSPKRRLWNQAHWWVGRAAALVAIANVYEGFIGVLDVSAGAWAAYTAVFAAIVGGSIAYEGYRYCQLPPPGYDKQATVAADSALASSQPSAAGLMGAAPSSNGLVGQAAAAKEIGLTPMEAAA